MSRKKVVIIQRTLKFYRLIFFDLLKQKCDENDMDLVLLYGADDKLTFNDAEIEWGIKIKNYSISILGRKFYFQNVFKYLKHADLIIVEQATKFFINYYLWLLNLLGLKKLAFWGHGINFNSRNYFSISEFVKKIMTRSISHFFAYNELSKRIILKTGLQQTKITVINNTIDVEGLKEKIKDYDKNKVDEIKKQLKIQTENVCLYVGGMYNEKRIPFLLEAISLVKDKVTDLEMIFIGEGPERHLVIKAAESSAWIHYVGPKRDDEKVPYFLISKLILLPFSVGLAIIDSFVFGVPLITTNSNGHGPEIDYLENGINGLMVEDDIEKYSNAVIRLSQNEEERKKLVKGCKESADKYTMENMVDGFCEGILLTINENQVW